MYQSVSEHSFQPSASPFRGILALNSVNVACCVALIWHESPKNCGIHPAEGNVQTRSRNLQSLAAERSRQLSWLVCRHTFAAGESVAAGRCRTAAAGQRKGADDCCKAEVMKCRQTTDDCCKAEVMKYRQTADRCRQSWMVDFWVSVMCDRKRYLCAAWFALISC